VPPSKDSEDNVYRAAKSGLQRFLGRAREVVMAPFRRFRAQPNPDAIYELVPEWQADVDRILAALTPVLREGWAAAHLPRDFAPDDPYIQANLALTRNLLVGIPDEVHALVVREIIEGGQHAESIEQIADRVDRVLEFTGSQNWANRARVIAQTETNRHYNSSLLAHALLVEREDGGTWTKEWQTLTDNKERPEHHAADHQKVPLNQPYVVGGEPLMFPGDPLGMPHNVINCRCHQTIEQMKEVGR